MPNYHRLGGEILLQWRDEMVGCVEQWTWVEGWMLFWGRKGVWSGWIRLILIEMWKHGDQFGGSSGSWIADREDLSVYTASPPVPVGLAG